MKSLMKIWNWNVWIALIPLLSLLQGTSIIMNMLLFQKSNNSCLERKIKDQKNSQGHFSINVFDMRILFTLEEIGYSIDV